MGGMFSKVISLFSGKKQAKVLILGLDGAGKTTLLYTMQLGKVEKVFPTVGFNTEQLNAGNVSFTLWDLGGQTHLRTYWRFYLPETGGLIYVVDSAERVRIPLAKQELQSLLSEPDLKDVPLAVLANKRDLPGSMPATELSKAMGLEEITDRVWSIFDASSMSKEYLGLRDGLEWLASNM